MVLISKQAMRADDFVAMTLEEIADKMPPQHIQEALTLRNHAKILRSSTNERMVTVDRIEQNQ